MSYQRFAAWLFGLQMLVAGTALAQEHPTEAHLAELRTVFEAAEHHFERGEFAQALEMFDRVHAGLSGHPRQALVLFNIGRTQEELGRLEPALEAYRGFLRETAPDAPYRDEAERRVTELELRLRQQRVDQSTGLGGSGRSSIHPAGIVVSAIAASLLVAGTITGAVALIQSEEIGANCDDSGRCPVDELARAQETQVLANVTDAFLFTGLGTAVVGLVLLLVLREQGSEESGMTSFTCGSSGCAFGAGARF